MKYKITQACTKCEACITVCPTGSIFMGARHYVIDADSCQGHAICVKVCKDSAIVPLEDDDKKVKAPVKSKK